MKNGEIKVDIKEEDLIWQDKKRWILFGLPWTFTQYKLTPSRLIITKGWLSKRIDEIRLYRIRDLSYHQTLGERMSGLGCIHIVSNDATLPAFTIEKIKKSQKVKEILSQAIENSRRENGVRASELVGGGPVPPIDGFHDGASLGPEIYPDANHNGIDDRTE